MYNFIQDETGAVTVDWVVLTAALVGLGLAVMAVVSGGVQTQSQAIDDKLTDGTVIKTAFTGSAQGALAAACAAGASCGGFVTGDALSTMSSADLATEVASANSLAGVADFDNTAYGSDPLVQNDSGSWGTYADPLDTTSTFTADSTANADFAQFSANDSYKASLAAEQGARAD